jgi:hypothetical protein
MKKLVFIISLLVLIVIKSATASTSQVLNKGPASKTKVIAGIVPTLVLTSISSNIDIVIIAGIVLLAETDAGQQVTDLLLNTKTPLPFSGNVSVNLSEVSNVIWPNQGVVMNSNLTVNMTAAAGIDPYMPLKFPLISSNSPSLAVNPINARS